MSDSAQIRSISFHQEINKTKEICFKQKLEAMENSKTNQTEIEKQILKQLQEIRKKMEENISVGDYLTREQTMIFLGYKKTTMRELEKSEKLTPSTLGRKKFYLKKQIIELLNKNIGLQNG